MKSLFLILFFSFSTFADQRIPLEMIKPIVESKIVYDRDEFHTDERDTGRKWDGRSIFRKCVSSGSYANNTLLVNASTRLIRQYGQTGYGAEFSSVPTTDGAGVRRFMVDTNNRIFWRTTQAQWIEACVEYVKL